MKELQAAGVSAIHIDDYGLPYKCPFIPPHVMGLEDMDLTAAKILSHGRRKRRSGVHGNRQSGKLMSPPSTPTKRSGAQIGCVVPRLIWRLAPTHSFPFAGQSNWPAGFGSQVPGPPLPSALRMGMPADRVQSSDAVMELSSRGLPILDIQMYIEPTTMIGVAANAMWEAAQKAKAAGHSNVLAEQHGNLYDHLEKWMDVSTVRRFRTKYVE